MGETAAAARHETSSSRALPSRCRLRDEDDELVLKTQLCGLMASTAFLLGSLLLLQTVPLLKALAGFLIALQLIPEIYIDSFQSQHPRRVSHGRYSAAAEEPQRSSGNWPVLWNKTQNAVFLMACVLQIVAFGVAVQLNRQPGLFRAYQIFNLAAAATWILSGLVVLLNRRLYWPSSSSCGKRGFNAKADVVDVVGNTLYVLGCLVWLIAGIAIFRSNDDLSNEVGSPLQRGAAGLWSVSALLHVSTDVGRLLCRTSNNRKLPRNNPASSPPPIRNETESSIGEDDSQA